MASTLDDGHDCEYLEHLNPAFFDELLEARARVTQPLEVFRTWLDWHYSGDAYSGRPADPTRDSLEEMIGLHLVNAGVTLKKGPEGIFGRVLIVVYEEVGINSVPDSAIARVLDHHPEWRSA